MTKWQSKMERGEIVNRPIQYEMLQLRRRMLGLTQSELANSLGISQGLLSKIEQGLKPIESEELLYKFANTLRCEVSFFSQREQLYGAPMSAHPMFRKQASVGQKMLDKLLAETNVRIAHIRTLLSSIELAPDLPLPRYDIDELSDGPEQAAEYVRRAWYLPNGPLDNLTVLCERAGCIIIPCDMGDAKIDGLTYRLAGLPPLIFMNKNLPGDRWRFTLAHELGHVVLHQYPSENMEDEANIFASALLMPKNDIGPYLRNIDIARAASLKPTWKVSMGALIVRAKTLRKITEGQSGYLWRQMSMQGYRLAEPPELQFPREVPSLLPAFFDHFRGHLGYTESDIVQILGLFIGELAGLYDLPAPWKPALRVVK